MTSCKTIWQSILLVGLFLPQFGVALSPKAGNVVGGNKGGCNNRNKDESTKLSIVSQLDEGQLKYKVTVITTVNKPKLKTTVVVYEGANCFKRTALNNEAYFCTIDTDAGPVILTMAKEKSAYHLKWQMPSPNGRNEGDNDWGSGFSCNVGNVIEENSALPSEEDPNIAERTEAGITHPGDLFDDGNPGITLLNEAHNLLSKIGYTNEQIGALEQSRSNSAETPDYYAGGTAIDDDFRYRPDERLESAVYELLTDPQRPQYFDEDADGYSDPNTDYDNGVQ